MSSIEWEDRLVSVPKHRNPVLVWGQVPTAEPGGDGSAFLGTSRYYAATKTFDMDHSGHCGLAFVTHWAEIEGPINHGRPTQG